MSADAVTNPPQTTATESKAARKKKAKAEVSRNVAVPSPTQATPTADSQVGAEDSKTNGVDGGSDNSFIKELQKSIRNINKKLNNTAKVDSIVAENPGVSFDALLASRKINADQKAQLDKKPKLQEDLKSCEEQLAKLKKIDEEYQQKAAVEKELLQSSHKQELETMREAVKVKVLAEENAASKDRFLTLSKFLSAAATKRQSDEPTSEESLAFEGLLLAIYGGNPEAVEAIEKLVNGSDDIVNNIEGKPTGLTYASIRQTAIDTPSPFANETAWAQDVAEAQAGDQEEQQVEATESDPTVVNAGLTELKDTTLANGAEEPSESTPPAASSIDTGAANDAANKQWDQAAKDGEDSLAESYEIIPRDPAEVETPAVPAAATSTQSWADEAHAEAAAATPPTAPAASGDEFHEVHRSRGGRGGRGDGAGGRGDGRGRGGRGRGEGRGRGGFRGRGEGRGGPRGGGGFRGGRGRGESGGAPQAAS